MLDRIRHINCRYQQFRPFRDSEAWALVRLAALAEGVSWTLLIIGITCKSLPVGWHEIPVAIAGRIHGMLFIVYIMAVLACGSSLGWSVAKTVFAGLLSAPPYGSVIFEQWEARHRRRTSWQRLYRHAWYHHLLTRTA